MGHGLADRIKMLYSYFCVFFFVSVQYYKFLAMLNARSTDNNNFEEAGNLYFVGCQLLRSFLLSTSHS